LWRGGKILLSERARSSGAAGNNTSESFLRGRQIKLAWLGKVMYCELNVNQRGSMAEQYITITDLSRDLGMDKTNLDRSILKKLKIAPQYMRTPSSKNQRVRVFTPEQVDQIKKYREGFSLPEDRLDLIYIIQPDPERIPNRIKVGYSSDFPKRILTYRTICPDCKVVGTWGLGKEFELPIIRMILKSGGTLVTGEIIDGVVVDEVKEQVNKFASMMQVEQSK